MELHQQPIKARGDFYYFSTAEVFFIIAISLKNIYAWGHRSVTVNFSGTLARNRDSRYHLINVWENITYNHI